MNYISDIILKVMSEKKNNPSINEGRVERILSEYLVPDQKFRDEKIENMIVFFL